MDITKVTGMTNDEKNLIEELKKRFGNEIKQEYKSDDLLFLRFLRARNANINKSEAMLRNHFQWREKNNMDNIASFQKPEAWKYMPFSLLGVDKTGSPVRYFNSGNKDAKGLYKSMKIEDYVKCLTAELESDVELMKKKSKELQHLVYQWTYILDFETFTLSKATYRPNLQMMTKCTAVLEAHFPERMKSMYVINASKYFTMVFNILKPLMTSRSLSKVKIFSKDGWKEELLKVIDAEVLPAFLGGKKTDPDGNPKCVTFMNQGGLVPKSLYLRNKTERLCNQADIKKLNISSKGKEAVELEVEESGTMIEWDFETEEGDIEFSLGFAPKDGVGGTPEELIPKQRIDANLAIETGAYRCENPGKYILTFDNSYNKTKDKTVFYRAAVVKAGSESLAFS